MSIQLLLFSGNSLRSQTWIHQVNAEIASAFSSTYVQEYAHWLNGEKNIDLDHELAVLRTVSRDFEPGYGVFAKSIGTVFVARALEARSITPKFLLFCGLPLGFIESDYPQFAKVIAEANLPTTVIHNTDDPVGSANAARNLMAKAFVDRTDYHFIETPGDTHEYLDFDLIRATLHSSS